MPNSIEALKGRLQKLITKFQADREYYLSSKYLEAQARVDFVTPFFKALGWDVENEAGALHHQREVIVERGEAETEGRPDYSFRIAGQTRFFVEANTASMAWTNCGDFNSIGPISSTITTFATFKARLIAATPTRSTSARLTQYLPTLGAPGNV